MTENKKWSEVGEILASSGTTKICAIHTPVGGGNPNNRLIDVNSLDYTKLSGANYVFVRGNGTPQQNATELQAAYDKAKTMSPGINNRITVVIAPGTYTFGVTKFPVNTPYINIIPLTGNPDVLLDGIAVSVENIYLKGLNCGTNTFIIADNLDNLVCEWCAGSASSFGGDNTTTSGTFTNCTGGDNSFGGSYGTASGTFTNCTGGDYSFGNNYGTASGTFEYCTGGDYSFGVTITSGATFTNCTGGDYSFGGGGTANGTFENCTGGVFSFGGGSGTANGTFKNCTGGVSSFGGGTGTASGTFGNCTGGDSSFGGSGTITSTARLYYCRLTSGTFETPQAGGKLVFCIDGNNLPVTTP